MLDAFICAIFNNALSYMIFFGHWAILRVLWEDQGITQKNISLRTGLMEPTVHQALVNMENQNIIVHERVNGNQKNGMSF